MISPLPGITATKPGGDEAPSGIGRQSSHDGNEVGDGEAAISCSLTRGPGCCGALGDPERYADLLFALPRLLLRGTARRRRDGDLWLLGGSTTS